MGDTKHAVIGISRSFAMPYHYAKTGVRVLTMCPGVTETALVASLVGKLLDIVDPEYAAAEAKTLPSQKVENVAHGMMFVIRSAQNGSIWIVEDPAYEISIPDRFSMKIPA